MSPREWTAAEATYEEYEKLPPDLLRGFNWCNANSIAYVCTRYPDHTGRHAAGDGHRIVKVWGD